MRELRHLVRIKVFALNTISTLTDFGSSAIETDGPWPWIVAPFWIHTAFRGVLPLSLADVTQLQWFQYVLQCQALETSLSPPLRFNSVLADVARLAGAVTPAAASPIANAPTAARRPRAGRYHGRADLPLSCSPRSLPGMTYVLAGSCTSVSPSQAHPPRPT